MTILHKAPTRVDEQRGARRTNRSQVRNDRPNRSRAAQRAIDRHHRKAGRGTVAPAARRTGGGLSATGASMRERLQHTPFLVPVIALLVIGLGLSLWLSTKAAQDSYRLGIEKTQNQSLVDQRDALKRAYESGNSAPELADKASRLGMVPAGNPARMIVEGDGRPRVVGKPTPASGKPMGSLNPKTEPDPAETIDPKEVDDSIGLGGSAAGGANPNSEDADGSAPTTPSPSAPDAAATPAPTPGANTTPPGANTLPPGANTTPSDPPAPVPSGPTPAPNVVPTP